VPDRFALTITRSIRREWKMSKMQRKFSNGEQRMSRVVARERPWQKI